MSSITDTVVSGVNNILNVFSSPIESDTNNVEKIESTSKNTSIFLLGKEGEPVETIDMIQDNITFHLDDSIRVVKNKLLKVFEKYNISYKEIYMFSNTKTNISLKNIYQSVTERGEPLSFPKLKQLCKNFGIENVPEEKNNYSLEDFTALNKTQSFSFPMGQRFEKKHNHLFSANPYDIVMVLPDMKENPLFSFENSLLLNWIHDIKMNSTDIFVCTAEDVIEHAEKHNISAEYVIQVYFPFLYKDGIRTLANLLEKKQQLLDDYRKTITEQTWKLYETVDLFYKIREQATTPLPYISSGISAFKMILHTDFASVLPLDTIFKKIHVTDKIPFIKYNPGFRRENIYRLYSKHIASNGKKIPVLSSQEIMRLSKETGKTGQITLYIQDTFQNQSIQVYLNFNKDGNIYLKTVLKTPVTTEDIVPIILQIIQPILEELNVFLFETGYQIHIPTADMIGSPSFGQSTSGFSREGIMEIEQIQYKASIKITKKMDLKKYKGCLGSVFDIEETDLSADKGAKLKFKRVENYQEMDPISMAISRTYSKTREMEDVISELLDEFKFSEDQAREHVVKFFGEHTLIQGKLVDNAGFPVTLHFIPSDNRLDIIIDQIQSIQYVDAVSGYLESIVRIYQYPDTSSPIETFATSCKKNVNYKNVDKSNIDNIVAVDNASLSKVVQPILFSSTDETNMDLFGEKEETMNDEDKDENKDEDKEETMNDEDKDENKDEDKDVDEVNESDYDFDEDNDEQEKKPKKTNNKKSSSNDSDDGSLFGMDMEGGAGQMREAHQQLTSKVASPPEKFGGGEEDDDELLEINVEGKSIKNPNPFQEKIEKYDPVLVLKKEKGQYNPYSKSCPPAVMRQPVILTQSEKDRIDTQHPGSYSTAIQYSSDPNKEKQFWYICPRYWSLKNNTSLTPEEVADILKTNPNAIIPAKAKVVPKGSFIYEFNAPKEHLDEKGNYITHYPGLMKGKHPDGFSLPCCFKRVQAVEKVDVIQPTSQKINVYVMSANSRPLQENRFGFLPEQLQRFLKTDNNMCVEKTNSALIKNNVSCILRYGVESSEQQSFIGCIADIYAFSHNLKKKPTIDEMRKILSESVTLDMFLQYHNGSLVSIFKPSEKKPAEFDKNKYKDSWFVKEITKNANNDEEKSFMKETIAAYESFLRYLLDETTYIDHTYLWDIVTQPNPKLMINGMNMIILTIPKPNQVEIICPTSAYSPKLFYHTKGTWILYKDGDSYEPIYIFENKSGVIIHKLFQSGKKSTNNKMENMLQFLEKTLQSQCSPKNSLPQQYHFKKNMSASEMLHTLVANDYNVHYQVMNYQSKIIGMIISSDTIRFFVPCSPSGILDNQDLILINQVKDWKDYNTTVQELNKLYVKTEGKIKCSPKMKIIDDKKIVGIITETEQYVKIMPVIENVSDLLDEIAGVDYFEADNSIIGSTAPNNKRIRTIRNIHMESRFYRIFRTMVRELLSQYETRFYKLQIRDMLENLTYSYSQKMAKIEEILRKMIGDSIEFRRMNDNTIEYMDDDVNFMNYIRCKQCNTHNVCKTSSDGKCHLYLPRNNLVMGVNNDELYYARLSDELLRFHRIRLFMLEPMHYLNLTNIDYKINDDEILLLETFLKSENFSDLRLFNFNEYLRQIPYDIAV